MNNFKDMIEKGIAPARYTTYGSEMPSTDKMVRYYNTYWGAMTDTHMSEFDTGWIITGSRVNRTELFRSLLNADRWEDLKFPESFSYYMMQHDLCGQNVLMNGQVAFFIQKWDNPDKPNPVFIDEVRRVTTPQTADRFNRCGSCFCDD